MAHFDVYLKNGFFVSLDIYTTSGPVYLETIYKWLNFCFHSDPIRHGPTSEILKTGLPPKTTLSALQVQILISTIYMHSLTFKESSHGV